MYLEFFLLVFDYFRTLKLRIVLYEIAIPILISLGVVYLLICGKETSYAAVFSDNAITLLGVLLGFSITIVTILTTGNSTNLISIKEVKTNFKINAKTLSLFDLLLVNFIYSIVIEIMLIIVLLIYPILLSIGDFYEIIKIIGFSGVVGLTVHILLLTMRNLTDFYLILIKNIKF